YLYLTLDLSVFLFVALGIVLASIAVQRGADLSQAIARREQELQTLNDFARALSAARLDEREIIELLFAHAARVMDTSNFAISLVDERTQRVELALWYRGGEPQPPRHYERMAGLAAWVSEQRQPLLLRDLHSNEGPVRGLLHTGQRTRSALFVPMTGKQKVLGVISVQSEAPNRYTPEHERTLAAMAQQAALAIEQARVYRAAQYRATQLETIAEVSQRVAGIYELEDLMQFVVALVRVNFNYYHVDIYLLDGDVLVHHAGTEEEETAHAYVPIADTSLIGTVARSGEPLMVNEVRDEPRFRMDPSAPNTRAELIVPLRAENKVLGVLEVQADQADTFQESDLHVLQTLGDQVALAIQEAELFTSVQSEAYISNALLQVAEAVGTLGSVDDILKTIVQVTPLLVGVERMLILLAEPGTNSLAVRAAYGVDDKREPAMESSHVPLDVIVTQGEHPSSNAAYEISLPEDLQQRWQMIAALVLPLVMRGTLLGVICVDPIAALEPRRVQLLGGIANQAALAIEAVQLETERDLRARLDQELNIARTIQSSLLPDHTPAIPGFDVAAVWTPALQVAGDFYDFLPLVDGRWGITVADVADKGVPAAIYMTLARTIIRAIGLGKATRRTPHQVLERANEIIVADARTDMFVTAFYAVLDPEQADLCYASAGHCPPLLVRCADHSTEWLRGRGLPLGVLANIDLEEHARTLHPGDLVVFYTDGITEAMNTDNDLFGTDRLRQAALTAHHGDAQSVMQGILSSVHDFAAGQEQVDDLSMVVLRRV
ncbi:MAG: GAF domain-containing protein, partial [Chloroflexi bacterium]